MECQFRPLLTDWIQTASLGVKAAPPPPPAVVIKDKEERDGCLLEERPLLRGLPWLPGTGSFWTGCPVSRTFPESSEVCCPGPCFPIFTWPCISSGYPKDLQTVGLFFCSLKKKTKNKKETATKKKKQKTLGIRI